MLPTAHEASGNTPTRCRFGSILLGDVGWIEIPTTPWWPQDVLSHHRRSHSHLPRSSRMESRFSHQKILYFERSPPWHFKTARCLLWNIMLGKSWDTSLAQVSLFSSHNHGSVENGCVSKTIISFTMGGRVPPFEVEGVVSSKNWLFL